MTMVELDRAYERMTDHLLDERFGTQDKEANVVEALRDVEIALKKLRECRDWLDNACAEDIPHELENHVGGYYEEIDRLVVRLTDGLEKWQKARW